MSDTIATLLTGRGRGAVATIAIEGSDAEAIVLKHFESATASNRTFRRNRIYFGTWRSKNYSEELVVCRTDEQRFEIHCHGGKLAAQNILQSLAESGSQTITPSEWSKMSEPNRFVREAKNQLPLAKTDRAVTILLDQTRGAMTKALQEIHEQMVTQPDTAIDRLESILAFANLGANLTRPFSVTLIGPPNSGKSSLVNAIVGFDRAIVYDQPGTTRDVVSAETALDGWPVSLSDTAGIRESDDPIERAGIETARRESASADLLLLVQDLSNDATNSVDFEISNQTKSITVGTKSDLISESVEAVEPPHLDVSTSSTTGQGIELLCERIVAELVPGLPPTGRAVPISPWQVEQLNSLLAMLRKLAFDDASRLLSELLD